MSNDDIRDILNRVYAWPPGWQRLFAELALDIEAEIAGTPYHATDEELEAADEGLAGDPASDTAIEAAFARFRPRRD